MSSHPSVINYKFLTSAGITAGTTLRDDSFRYSHYTAENDNEISLVNDSRKLLSESSGFKKLITLRQTHSDIIHFIDKNSILEFSENPLIEGDGLITFEKDLLIGVLTADCVPVFYTDLSGSFCGIVHAGWRGIMKNIHIKMIRKIEEISGTGPLNLQIIAGPHIKDCCYDVGPETINSLTSGSYRHSGDKCYLDMFSTIRSGLVSNGVCPENINPAIFCSKCSNEPRFYSYRGGDTKRRSLSFIGLKTL